MQNKLGLELCRHMFFLDVFTITSRIFHIEKSRVQQLKKLRYNENICGEFYN